MFPESPGAKKVDGAYHQFRLEASTETFSLDEFGEIDITRYDLEDGYIEGLPIPTGQDNPKSYEHNRGLDNRIQSDDTLDVRTLPTR
jgi:hypothetical protein